MPVGASAGAARGVRHDGERLLAHLVGLHARVSDHADRFGPADGLAGHEGGLRHLHHLVERGGDAARGGALGAALGHLPVPAGPGRGGQLARCGESHRGVVSHAGARLRHRPVQQRLDGGRDGGASARGVAGAHLRVAQRLSDNGRVGLSLARALVGPLPPPGRAPLAAKKRARADSSRTNGRAHNREDRLALAVPLPPGLGPGAGPHAGRPGLVVLCVLAAGVSQAGTRFQPSDDRLLRLDPFSGGRHRQPDRRRRLRPSGQTWLRSAPGAQDGDVRLRAADDGRHPGGAGPGGLGGRGVDQPGHLRLFCLGRQHSHSPRRSVSPADCGLGLGPERHRRRNRRHALHADHRLRRGPLLLRAGLHRGGPDAARLFRGHPLGVRLKRASG